MRNVALSPQKSNAFSLVAAGSYPPASADGAPLIINHLAARFGLSRRMAETVAQLAGLGHTPREAR